MTSSKYIPFIERSLPVDNLTPDRDFGIMVHGAYKPFGLHYGIGIFNGARSNESDADNHKDLVARVGYNPFHQERSMYFERAPPGIFHLLRRAGHSLPK